MAVDVHWKMQGTRGQNDRTQRHRPGHPSAWTSLCMLNGCVFCRVRAASATSYHCGATVWSQPELHTEHHHRAESTMYSGICVRASSVAGALHACIHEVVLSACMQYSTQAHRPWCRIIAQHAKPLGAGLHAQPLGRVLPCIQQCMPCIQQCMPYIQQCPPTTAHNVREDVPAPTCMHQIGGQ